MGKQATTGQVAGTTLFQFWESNPAQQTALETWQEAMARTADKMGAGTYRLTWYFEMRVNPTGAVNSNAMGRFLVDGNVKGNANVIGVDYHAFSGWDRFVATEGQQPVLSLEYQRDPVEGGNDNVQIRKMKLGVERMSDA